MRWTYYQVYKTSKIPFQDDKAVCDVNQDPIEPKNLACYEKFDWTWSEYRNVWITTGQFTARWQCWAWPEKWKRVMGWHYGAVLNEFEFWFWVEFLIGYFILQVTFSFDWVPIAHCAVRRSLNLFTVVSQSNCPILRCNYPCIPWM